MPIFEYECRQCRKSFEYLAKNLSDTPGACPHCGGKKLVKAFSAFSVGGERARMRELSSPAPACSSCTGGPCPYGQR